MYSKAIARTIEHYAGVQGIALDTVLWSLLGRLSVLPADERSLLEDIQRSFDRGVKVWAYARD